MQKAAAAANAARDDGHHGDHVLQGGHAVLKEDADLFAQDSNTSNVPGGASKQSYDLGGTRSGNLQAGAGTGAGLDNSTRQRNTQSHVGQAGFHIQFC